MGKRKHDSKEETKKMVKKSSKTRRSKKKTKKDDDDCVGGCFKQLFRKLLIHTGCLHNPTFDDVTTEGVTSHPDQLHHRGGLNREHNSYGRYDKYHHHHHNHHGGHNLIDDGLPHVDKDKDKQSFMTFNNCTYNCAECQGETYWVSFCEKSFHKGERFKFYRGIINGKGPFSGDKCVVKVFSDRYGTEALCHAETQKSEKLRQLIHAFNQMLGRDNPSRLRATRSYWAHIDEVSKLKKIFFTGDKRLASGEAVLFEQDVRKSDYSTKKCKQAISYVDQAGRWFDGAYASIINAFVHWTYKYSNGQLVVCGLNGVKDDGGYFFSTPTIHSTTIAYGNADQGATGISQVMRNHTCGEWCKQIILNKTVAHSPNAPLSPIFETDEGGFTDDVMSSSSIVPDDSIDCKRTPMHCSRTVADSNGNVLHRQPSLQPSAPSIDEEGIIMSEDNRNVLPPPYTPTQETRVAFWIVGEQAPNTFLHNVNPSSMTRSVTMDSSIECHSVYTGHRTVGSIDMESNGPNTSSTTRAFLDMNANFTCHNGGNRNEDDDNNKGNRNRSENESHSETAVTIEPRSEKDTTNYEPRSENDSITMASDRRRSDSVSSTKNIVSQSPLEEKTVITRHYNGLRPRSQTEPPTPMVASASAGRPEDKKKSVRFEVPDSQSNKSLPTTNCRRSSAPSVFTGISDDVTMDTCTNASISSGSPLLPSRSRSNSQRESVNSMANNFNNMLFSPQRDVQPSSNSNRNDDLPPPYEEHNTEHNMDTVNWVLDPRGYDYGGHSLRIIPASAIQFNNSHRFSNSHENIISNNGNSMNSGVLFALSPPPTDHPNVFNFPNRMS